LLLQLRHEFGVIKEPLYTIRKGSDLSVIDDRFVDEIHLATLRKACLNPFVNLRFDVEPLIPDFYGSAKRSFGFFPPQGPAAKTGSLFSVPCAFEAHGFT
jgi:hypothetical protein